MFINASDIRIGDTVIAGTFVNPTRNVVRTLVVRANDSIQPHVLVNGILTIPLTARVEVTRDDRRARARARARALIAAQYPTSVERDHAEALSIDGAATR